MCNDASFSLTLLLFWLCVSQKGTSSSGQMLTQFVQRSKVMDLVKHGEVVDYDTLNPSKHLSIAHSKRKFYPVRVTFFCVINRFFCFILIL